MNRTRTGDSVPLGQRVLPDSNRPPGRWPVTVGEGEARPRGPQQPGLLVRPCPSPRALRWRSSRPAARRLVHPAAELCGALTLVFFLLESVADIFSRHELSHGSPDFWHLRLDWRKVPAEYLVHCMMPALSP